MRGLPFLLIAPFLFAENWPSWRGSSQGRSSESAAPTRWSKTENVRWRAPLPEPGNSTPVVWGDRVFVTQAVKQGNRRTLMAFHADTGKLVWQSGVSHDGPDPTHQTNPLCSASPVTDGQTVVAWFGPAGLFAYDFDGKERWRLDLGKMRHTWGYGTSPVLHGGWVFLNFGPGDAAFLVAVDLKSGKIAWQKEYPKGAGKVFSNWTAEDMYGSWVTPLMIRNGGRDELIVSLPGRAVAFDPATGAERWSAPGLGDLVYPSPVFDGTTLLAASGFGGPTIGAKPGGEVLWRKEKSPAMIGSAVTKDGYAYVVHNGGIAECWELATGKVMWTQRLMGKGENNNIWSSPVLQGDRIYVMNQGGDTFLYQASPKQFEALGVNPLGERTNSSVVIAQGSVFLRTHEALYRIDAK